MKKILFLMLASAILMTSCNKVLDVNPTASISSDIALKDSTGVESAMLGAYNGLQAVGLYGRNAAIIADLAADNLVWTGTTQDYGQIMNKPIPAENAIADGMWTAAYDVINRVNNILYKLPDIPYGSVAGKNHIQGEALFIRALMQHYLASFFGGVPLRTQPTLDLSNLELEKSSQTDVYASAISDLETAIDLLSHTTTAGRANSSGAKALLARVYLSQFHLTNDASFATKAMQMSSDLIAFLPGLATTYSELFDPAVPSTESIFEVIYDNQNFNRLAQYYYTRDLNGRYEIAPSAGLIAAFDTADARLDVSIRYDEKNNPYGAKYNDVAGGVDRVNVLRLAEMYLIHAEALAYTNGDVAAIQNDINVIRHRAGLPDTEAADIASLKLAIENERRFEFAFEGHRWHDLVRTGRAAEVLGIDQKFTLFPIPLSEMQTNKKMQQNPGY